MIVRLSGRCSPHRLCDAVWTRCEHIVYTPENYYKVLTMLRFGDVIAHIPMKNLWHLSVSTNDVI